ncbi:MAG: DUF6089 family protein [Bacteroidetes bacterium]|nr:DUF6089 family protein [Bacteroidota bacterium]MCL2302460.1 DUF6089 family protein [Lentimicrobiaceae bacterium]
MKKSCLILLCFITLHFCQAQRSEIGTMLGTSFYLGDLNSMPFRDAKFAGGIVYRYNFTPRWALKANILFGKIAASDANNHSILYDVIDEQKVYKWDYRDRGLSFSSPITEISAQVEINFFNVYNVSHKNHISPYLFGGFAVFSFNPQANYTDPKTKITKTYDLQPIVTEWKLDEDVHTKYRLTGFAIPFGIGFKANIGRYVCVGAEWGLRFTFTDHLDDVSGRYLDVLPLKHTMSEDNFNVVAHFADPSADLNANPIKRHTPGSQRYSTIKTDWYSFAGVIITVRIGNEDRICDLKTNVKLKNKQGRKR